MDPSSSMKPTRPVRWHILFYVLATFDIATILLSIYLTQEVLSIYRRSVVENQDWADRASSIAELVDLAGAANAPGNDAFDSGDIALETQRLTLAMKAYEDAYHKVIAELQTNVPPEIASPMSLLLIGFNKDVLNIKQEATAVFRLLGKGDRVGAGEHMAEMDRSFGRAMSQNTELRKSIRNHQNAQFTAHTTRAARLGGYAFLIIIMVGATILGGVAFGALSRRLARAEQEQAYAHALVQQQNDDLRHYSARLEATKSELVSHAEELQAEKLRADQANVAKSQFLANMSHEIRTPLNGVIGMLDLLSGTSTDSRQKRFIGIAKTSANTLLSLINDVLDFSKIEAGKFELEHLPFNLPLLMEDVSEMFSHRAAAKSLELACHVRADVPSKVRGDQERLRQVLTNFIGNAIKFTELGEVRIRAELVERREDEAEVRISVRDTGIGIPQDRISRLFSPFTQVDASTTRKYGGTGLGLAISKQLIELMGGTFGVESSAGVGSTFWMKIPFPIVLEHGGVRGAKESFAGIHVLAVDDIATNLEILEEQLTSWGMHVTLASDAMTGLEIMRHFQAEGRELPLVILDHHMPQISGLQLAEMIKSDSNLRSTKLLMLSSDDTMLERGQWSQYGLSGMMTKPIRASRLFDVITGVLNQKVDLPPVHEERLSTLPPKKFTKGKILVCEDNEINQMVTSEIVRSAGLEVDVVENGRLGIEAIKRGGYDLVLMDCQMPEMDGFEATREIRRLESEGTLIHHFAGKLPIIALTANALDGDKIRCDDAGMDDYVTKPVDRNLLIQAIDRNIRIKQVEEESLENDTPRIPEQPPAEAIRFDDLLTRCGGDRNFAHRLLRKFQDRLPTERDKISKAIQERSRKEAATLAHTLKGTAGNMSASLLRAAAADVELICKTEKWDETSASLDRLFAEIDRCLEAVNQLESASN